MQIKYQRIEAIKCHQTQFRELKRKSTVWSSCRSFVVPLTMESCTRSAVPWLVGWLAHKFTCFLLRYAMCMNSFLSLSLRHSFSSALCSSAEQFFSGSVRCGCSLFPVFSSFLFSFDLYILLPSFTIHLIVFWSTFYTKRVCAVNQNFYFLFKMK